VHLRHLARCIPFRPVSHIASQVTVIRCTVQERADGRAGRRGVVEEWWTLKWPPARFARPKRTPIARW